MATEKEYLEKIKSVYRERLKTLRDACINNTLLMVFRHL